MNLSLVLAEADQFHRQTLKKRKACCVFEAMHIAAYELTQTVAAPQPMLIGTSSRYVALS
jgi:hypothetical protein